MATEYTPEELVARTFFMTMVGIGLFIGIVFLYIL